jgi:rhomboid protease GluP
MNGAGLLAVGPLIEVHSRRDHIPLVFLVSALAGSVASVLLYPNTTSVGASGGLMGFTGFLLVLGCRRRERLPHGFAGAVVLVIAATAVLGLVGFALIDNAAHLGGLVAGWLLGLVLERRGMIDPGASRATRTLGHLSAAVLLAGAAWCVLAMHR